MAVGLSFTHTKQACSQSCALRAVVQSMKKLGSNPIHLPPQATPSHPLAMSLIPPCKLYAGGLKISYVELAFLSAWWHGYCPSGVCQPSTLAYTWGATGTPPRHKFHTECTLAFLQSSCAPPLPENWWHFYSIFFCPFVHFLLSYLGISLNSLPV